MSTDAIIYFLPTEDYEIWIAKLQEFNVILEEETYKKKRNCR